VDSRDFFSIEDLTSQKKFSPEERAKNEAEEAKVLKEVKAEEEKQRKLREQQLKECLESLGFPEMTQRRKSANCAYPGTCSWILSNHLYQKWLDLQCGLLWIKGNPGSGKSTIMAFLFGEMIQNSGQRGQCRQICPQNPRTIINR
jgi:predicted NACHT family NTPase